MPAKINMYNEIKAIIEKYREDKSTPPIFSIFCSSRLICNFPYSYFVLRCLINSKTEASYVYEDCNYFSCKFCLKKSKIKFYFYLAFKAL